MEWLGALGQGIIEWTETVLWTATWLGILAGLILEIGRRLKAWRSAVRGRLPGRHSGTSGSLRHTPIAIAVLTLALPCAAAAQGWWGGSPINPGYDRNTVIQVIGTVTQVNIVSRGGPSTLHLETSGETFTVMLGPGWYLAELHADIRSGDILTLEGSKMMDRWGQLHLAAARIVNQRNGTVLELRDETGRPRWMGGGPSGRLGR